MDFTSTLHSGEDIAALLNQPTGTVLGSIVLSIIFLVMAVGLRYLLLRTALGREGLTAESRRRLIVNSRNVLIVIVVTGLVFIWANELAAFAVSLVAIAAALVIATKELILCFSGAVLRAGTKAFSLGDRIVLGGTRGEVVDLNLFAATVREIGPGKGFTGRAVVIPNSLLLNQPVINETFLGDYIIHVISVPWGMEDWIQAERLLLEAARVECAPFLDEARRHMQRLSDRAGLEAPSVEPRVTLEIPEPKRVNLQLRIPAPVRLQGRLEQSVLRRFLESCQANASGPPAAAGKEG